MLCKVYTGVYLQKKHMKADLKAVEDNLAQQKQSEEASSKEPEKNSFIQENAGEVKEG